MLRVAVCVGSACHLKGSKQVVAILKDLIKTYDLEDQVCLEGFFCHGHCLEGVVIRIGTELITGVRKDNVFRLFQSQILARCKV